MESASFPESSTSDVLILFLLLAINLSVTVIDFLSFPQIIARYVFVIFLVLNKPLKCFKNSLFFDKTIHPDVSLSSLWHKSMSFAEYILLTPSIKVNFCPDPPWTLIPSGLLITIKSSSSKIIAFFISFSIFGGKFLKLLSLFSD